MSTHPKQLSTPDALAELVYVCSISEFNLPEYESCLLRRPRYLVLLVSNYTKAQAAAELFSRVVKDALPGVQIIRPDQLGGAFDGASLGHFQRWLEDVLIPCLDGLPVAERVCNVTGGTKMMAMALLNTELGWGWLEYKADGRNTLQRIELQRGALVDIGQEELEPASPVDVARLYSEHVQQTRENAVFRCEGSASKAQQLWDGLAVGDPSLLQLFGNEKCGLEMVWMYGLGRKEYNCKRLALTAHDFIAQPLFTDAHMRWLEQWAELEPSNLQVNKQGLELPGNKSRRADLRRWLSGDWLEQLAYVWLREKIPTEHIRMNVRVRPENESNSSTGERETDILVHFKGRTSIIEAKTDLPPGQSIADAIRQLASITGRFGRVTKVLFVGPQLLQKIQQAQSDLALRCKAEGIVLAHNRESLLEAILLNKEL